MYYLGQSFMFTGTFTISYNGVMIFLPMVVLLQAWNEIKFRSEPKLFPQENIQGKGLVQLHVFCNEDLFSKLMSMTLILEIILSRQIC